MIKIAIDPGASGGFAVDCFGSISTAAMPKTDLDIFDYLRSWRVIADSKICPVSVMMEKVTGFIGYREMTKTMPCPHCHKAISYSERQGDPASAMFEFGDGVGFLRGACISLGFRFETVPPRVWQVCVGMTKAKGISKTAWKNQLKDRARKLFPDSKVTLSTADALLILEYSKRKA
jgi:hypothetical protein